MRAAELAKCDLTTEVVGEFPELQGIVGGLYAKAQGEPNAVADAIYDHYRPVSAEDDLPRTKVGRVIAIADRLDTLGGLFRVGVIPTGSKDPFALRRAAYGIIHILIRAGYSLSISNLCHLAEAGHNSEALREFFLDRLRYCLSEDTTDGVTHRYDEINAVLSASDEQPLDVKRRAKAISIVRRTPDFEPLALSFKRIKNILEQAGGIQQFAVQPVDEGLLEAGAESNLYTAFQTMKPVVARFREQCDYVSALHNIASFYGALYQFFDEVLVMANDVNVRRNRLTFLAQLLREFSTIANFAEIVSAEGADT